MEDELQIHKLQAGTEYQKRRTESELGGSGCIGIIFG